MVWPSESYLAVKNVKRMSSPKEAFIIQFIITHVFESVSIKAMRKGKVMATNKRIATIHKSHFVLYELLG